MLTGLMETSAPASLWLVQLMVGAVFVSEGVQKFLFPENVGAGRFARIGLPAPEAMAAFVGAVEMTAGACVVPVSWCGLRRCR